MSCEHEHDHDHGDHVHIECGHGHHHHGHSHMHTHGVSGNIAVAFFLNLAFSILEFAGGAFVNSIAIISDAVHDLGDAMVIGVSYFLERKSAKDPDLRHSYGYRRYSVLGAVITTCVLIAGAVIVVATAIPRLIEPEPANYDGMIVFAIFGIAVNGFAAWRTSGGGSLNQRAVNLHMLEDVLGWVAVLIGAVVMRFTGWAIIDPILSICIACFIGYNAISNMRAALPIFLERTPVGMDVDGLMDGIVDEIEGVFGIHHLHVWSIDEELAVATLHAVAVDGADLPAVKQGIKEYLAEHGVAHSTVEMENIGEDCPEDCPICPCVHSASCGHTHHDHDHDHDYDTSAAANSPTARAEGSE